MNDNKYILGAGSPLIDLLIHVDETFLQSIDGEKGGMVLVDDAGMDRILGTAGVKPVRVPGGSACNTIFGVAMLGMPTAFIGKLGRDDDGAFLRRSLEDLGGRGTSFRYSDDTHTGRCLSMITPDSDRTMRTNLGAALQFASTDIAPEDFKDVRHFHIEGYLLYVPGVVERLVTLAKEAGCTLSIDLASFEVVRNCKAELDKLLPQFDIVFANEDEAVELLGPGTPEEWAARLSAIVPVACIKLGKQGSIVKTASSYDRVPAHLVEAVDATGAGDLWGSGFLYGYLNGYNMADSARFGSILGAEVVQVVGPKIPADRWPLIKQQMGVQE